MKHIFLPLILFFASCTSRYDLIIEDVNIIDIETGELSIQDVFINDSLIVTISNKKSIHEKAKKLING